MLRSTRLDMTQTDVLENVKMWTSRFKETGFHDIFLENALRYVPTFEC